MPERTQRVLIVGRSPAALIGAVDRLRELGYGANASNQFERLLEDYDAREVDLVLFGGMVPTDLGHTPEESRDQADIDIPDIRR